MEKERVSTGCCEWALENYWGGKRRPDKNSFLSFSQFSSRFSIAAPKAVDVEEIHGFTRYLQGRKEMKMTSVLLLLLLFLSIYFFLPFSAVLHLNEEPTPPIVYFMVALASVVWLIAVTAEILGSKESRTTAHNQEVDEEESEH